MANISLTTECNRDCAYCFAREARRSGAGHMSVQTFERALDFLERSGIGEARLLGGEPTLHPEFPRLAQMALERGLRVRVFSNGLMPEPALQWLESHPPGPVAVLVNIAESDPVGPGVLRRLRNRVTLGFNIHTPEFNPGFLLHLIRQYRLSPSVRFGLAHPTADGSNHFLRQIDYRRVGERLAQFVTAARAAGVEPAFDCGFVPCMFPAGFLGTLGSATAGIGLSCSPVLDILPDGRVGACYPLVALTQEPMPEGATAETLRCRLTAKLGGYRRLGVFRECAVCAARESGTCGGGCLAASMQRLRTLA